MRTVNIAHILPLLLLIPVISANYAWRGNEAGHDENSGLLCEPNLENDTIGAALGCSCSPLEPQNVHALKAECEDLKIGCENLEKTAQLKINMSSFLIKVDFSKNCISQMSSNVSTF